MAFGIRRTPTVWTKNIANYGAMAGMRLAAADAMISEDKRPIQDEDLARWAKELGVSYEELASTLNYAGPTFKDLTFSSEARRAGSTSIPS